MLLQEKSLSLKLLLVVGVLLVVMSLSFILVSSTSLNSAETDIVNDVSSEVRAQIEQTVAAKSSAIAYEIANIFNESYVYPHKLANQIAASIEGKLPTAYNRGQVEAMVRNTLSYSKVSSAYAQFEANKFDANDTQHLEGFSHSVVGSGSLEVYFVREQDGKISQQIIENSTEKHDETLDEFGNRAAEWYLCSMDKMKACIINPYNYEIRPGYSELMTSLVVPVVADGEFRGVVGSDLNLPILQEKAKQLKASLYGGKASVLVVSQDGFLAAATEHEKSLARPIKEVIKNSADLLSISGTSKSKIIGNLLYFVRPININVPNDNWQLIVGIDLNQAMLPVEKISSDISDRISKIIVSFLILAAISTVIALALVHLFTKSVIKPVKTVADRMAELAGQGGDLTQELQVHSHAELISLSTAFNQFREKVRELLERAKLSGQSVLVQSEESKGHAE